MAREVIYPLSEDTGREIVSMLARIAVAIESLGSGAPSVSSSVDNDVLSLTGAGATVEDDVVNVNGSASVSDGVLEL